ncbi:MAG: diguanylate cyclase [Pseudomonadota bacterium]|nr:diguanylate cyclase [Pseudomonadota bacterium]
MSAPVDLPELVERLETLVQELAAGTKGRVMIVDDDRELAEHYCLVLNSAGIEAHAVSDPLTLLSELYAFEPELLLMDIELGAHSGVVLARMIRFHARWLSLPIVYLSSEDDPERQLRALSGGADEFLVKPISDDYLIRAVQMRCHRARQLSELMNRDSLTRLLKHSVIKQEVERERQRCTRGDYSSVAVLLDIDHFKQVNDTWGHAQGDVVIRTLANLLRNRLRESDAIGRYGGEEFLVVLPHCEPSAALRLMSGILESFSELEFSSEDDVFHVTFSAGVAKINDFSAGDQIIEAADKALYERKRNGRNGVTLYTDNA